MLWLQARLPTCHDTSCDDERGAASSFRWLLRTLGPSCVITIKRSSLIEEVKAGKREMNGKNIPIWSKRKVVTAELGESVMASQVHSCWPWGQSGGCLLGPGLQDRGAPSPQCRWGRQGRQGDRLSETWFCPWSCQCSLPCVPTQGQTP